MNKLQGYLRVQFDELATIVRYEDSPFGEWGAASIVEDCRIRCIAFGYADIGAEVASVEPREALRIIGAMLAWARGQDKPSTLTVAEAAERLQVCRQTIYSMCNAGTLACIRAGRSIRIPADAIAPVPQQPTVAPRLLGKDHFA